MLAPACVLVLIGAACPSAQRTEEGLQIPGIEFGYLQSGEISASWHLCPTLDTQSALRKGARRRSVFGEEGHSHRNFDALPSFERWRVALLVVRAKRGIDRLGHPIDHTIGEQFIFGILALKIASMSLQP